jgi:plastocyanin
MSAHSRLLVCAACTVLVILACIAAGCSSYQPPATTAPPVSATAPVSTVQPVSTGVPGSTAAPVSTGVNTVSIKNFAFNPSSLAVKTGSAVTWVNQDGVAHTIVSDTGSPLTFSSDPLQTGASFTFSFTQPGTYTYHCSIHPSMTGTIVVQS